MTQTILAAQYAKGSTLRSTLAFVRSLAGEEGVARVLERVPADDLARIRSAAATDEVPHELLLSLWRAVDAEIGAEHPDWPERSGAFSIASAGVEHYSGILRKKSPAEFLLQRVSLFRLFYQPGNQEVVEEDAGRAVLRLVGFDPGHATFCRRQTGGLLHAVQLAGGVDATVRHVRCSLEGDAFCEWELRWGMPAE
ncbi:hypothetical protein [Longimicrobium sp.]|uniref:hypothetical protein n=1 Tax=Longimicrobium sp. TaxID=2029185 RepID=UPI002E3330F9|nr:hypothetical protein [Longimicrobium sp.]HEX6039573.1 hypothetical protein [Longimicrobium sp.]